MFQSFAVLYFALRQAPVIISGPMDDCDLQSPGSGPPYQAAGCNNGSGVCARTFTFIDRLTEKLVKGEINANQAGREFCEVCRQMQDKGMLPDGMTCAAK